MEEFDRVIRLIPLCLSEQYSFNYSSLVCLLASVTHRDKEPVQTAVTRQLLFVFDESFVFSESLCDALDINIVESSGY